MSASAAAWIRFTRERLAADRSRVRYPCGAVGVSSNAMLVYACGGRKPTSWEYPSDDGDLARCRLTFRLMPEGPEKRRAAETLARYVLRLNADRSLRKSGLRWRPS